MKDNNENKETDKEACLLSFARVYSALGNLERAYYKLASAYRGIASETKNYYQGKCDGARQVRCLLGDLITAFGGYDPYFSLGPIGPNAVETFCELLYNEAAKAQGKPNAPKKASSKPAGSKTKKKRENTRPSPEAKPSEPENGENGNE